MLKQFFFVIFLLTAHFYNAESQESFYPESNFSAQEDAWFLHTVERGQTVYALSVIYNTAVEAIYRLNPESRDGIRAGEKIKIPQQPRRNVAFHTIQPKETLYAVSRRYNISAEDILLANPGLSIKTFNAGKNILVPLDREISVGQNEMKSVSGTEMEINALLTQPQQKIAIGAKTINVAMLLPFGTVDRDADASGQVQRVVEYCEGFLMSLDTLKRTGISVNLNIYDIGNRPESLQNILNKQELRGSHLLVGGRTAEQIKSISDYAQANSIWYVVPFSSKADETLVNPYVFQINPPQSYLYSRVSQAVADRYGDCSIIFVNVQDTASDKSKFVRTLQADLSANRQSYKTLTYNARTFNADIRKELSSIRKNVIILSSASSEALNRIVSPLRVLKESGADTEVSLFGYPEWQTYFKEHIDNFFLTGTCLYSVFYADNTDEDTRRFYSAYKSWYGKAPVNTYPKYSLLGYDTGMYFIRLFHQSEAGVSLSAEPVKYHGLQSGFNFKRISNWSGFINSNVFLIDFLPDYSIRRNAVK
jgi:LysM repeat protein/ABC-type branched-subunit amino acid transport system substrate-binding protein